MISIDDEENELPESKETPAPLTYETPKQDKINKQINVEMFCLLYIKRRSLIKWPKMTERKLKDSKVT